MRLARFVLISPAFVVSLAFAQQAQHPNPSGFGSVLYPGLGGPPPASAHGGFGSVLYPGTGGPPGSRPPVVRPAPGNRNFAPPPQAHPGHSRAAIVPYPVYYGGGYAESGGNTYTQQPAPAYDYGLADSGQGQSPVVILNQGFRPDYGYSPRDQQDHAFTPREPAPEREATIYLLAMADHTIIPAIAYWADGDTLSYITTEGSQNRVSLSLVDREFSKQLNDSRNVEFRLPAAK